MSDTFTVHVPMAFRRRGGRKLIVGPDGAAMPAIPQRFSIDNVLVKALARSFRWQKLLEDGTSRTIKEISTKEKIDPSYVGDVLRLTLLAPDIIEMILDGRQPPGLQFRAAAKIISFGLASSTKRHTRQQGLSPLLPTERTSRGVAFMSALGQ